MPSKIKIDDDLKKKVLLEYDSGKPVKQLSEEYDLLVEVIENWIRERENLSRIEAVFVTNEAKGSSFQKVISTFYSNFANGIAFVKSKSVWKFLSILLSSIAGIAMFTFVIVKIEGRINARGELKPKLEINPNIDSLILESTNEISTKIDKQIEISSRIEKNTNISITNNTYKKGNGWGTRQRRHTNKAKAHGNIKCCCCKSVKDSVTDNCKKVN